MDIFEAIRERRAARSFLPKPVGETTLQALLGAAVRAPSAGNRQPWSFVIIQDAAFLRRLSDTAKKRLGVDRHWGAQFADTGSSSDIFYGAPALVVICARRDGYEPLGDCYLAGQNLMLAAFAMGLATCPVAQVREALDMPPMRRLLHLPGEVEAVLPIAVGYPGEPMPWTERASPVIHSWIQTRAQHLRRRSVTA